MVGLSNIRGYNKHVNSCPGKSVAHSYFTSYFVSPLRRQLKETWSRVKVFQKNDQHFRKSCYCETVAKTALEVKV